MNSLLDQERSVALQHVVHHTIKIPQDYRGWYFSLIYSYALSITYAMIAGSTPCDNGALSGRYSVGVFFGGEVEVSSKYTYNRLRNLARKHARFINLKRTK